MKSTCCKTCYTGLTGCMRVCIYCSSSCLCFGLECSCIISSQIYIKWLLAVLYITFVTHARTRHKLATRMAALLGSVDQFDPAVEDWAHYVERLGHFFSANGIVGDSEATTAKRRSTFLSVIGPGP